MQRARIIAYMLEDNSLYASDAGLKAGYSSVVTGPVWVRRFKLWTLERLQTAFQERHGIHLSDSTIWEWLEADGLEWKRQESWFHEAEKHDPEFVEKRGASSQLT